MKQPKQKSNSIVLKSINDFTVNNNNKKINNANQFTQISKMFDIENSQSFQFTIACRKRNVKTQTIDDSITFKDNFFRRYVDLASSLQKEKIVEQSMRFTILGNKSKSVNIKNNYIQIQNSPKINRKYIYVSNQNKNIKQKQQKRLHIIEDLSNLKVSTALVLKKTQKNGYKQHMVNKIKKLVRELAPLNRSLNNSQVNAAQISTIKSVRKLIITSKSKNNRLKSIKKLQKSVPCNKLIKQSNQISQGKSEDQHKKYAQIGPWNVKFQQNLQF